MKKISHPLLVLILSYQVFNRWGELLFSTSSVNAGWNGFYKGVSSKSDTYVWNLSFKDKDGNAKELKGHALLLK